MVDSDPTGPFLTAEAQVLGISRKRLYSGGFRTVLRGVVVDARVPDTMVVRARAAMLVAPEGAIVSHWTAAHLWGGRVPDNDFVHLSFMRRVRCRLRGVKPHCFTYRMDSTTRHGVPVTTPLLTFCHMASALGLVDLVALGDSLVRKNRFSPAELRSFAVGWEGQHRERAIEAAQLVRSGVDSSPETALRLLLVLAGLPEPTVNIPIYDDDGHVRFRLDLGYEDVRVAIEYDGRWHQDPDQRRHDEERRTHLSVAEGWRFVVVKGDELFNAPESLLVRVVDELVAAGLQLGGVLSDDWRPHFRLTSVAA